MHAITLWQPWASLLVTRRTPCACEGRRHIINRQDGGYAEPCICTSMVKRFETRSWPCPPKIIGQRVALVVNLPLGAVVGSGTVTACYPIVHWRKCSDHTDHICQDVLGNLYLHLDLDNGGSDTESDISDQLPYGDFTPGRYAWLIEDAAPTTERCPWCWGEVYRDEDGEHGCRVLVGETDWGGVVAQAWVTCPACEGAGRCEPIPAKGKQRIWNWEPA